MWEVVSRCKHQPLQNSKIMIDFSVQLMTIKLQSTMMKEADAASNTSVLSVHDQVVSTCCTTYVTPFLQSVSIVKVH